MNILKIILLNLLIFSFSYSSTFEELSSKLSDNSFKVKEDVVSELIVNYKDEQRLEILLQNMLLGNLYFQNQSNEILFLEKENSKIKRFITLTQDSLDSMKANLTKRMETKLKQMNSFYNKGLNDFFTNSFIVDFAEIVMEKKVRGGIHYHLEDICREMQDGEDRLVSIDFYGDGLKDYVISKRSGFLVKLRQVKKDNLEEK